MTASVAKQWFNIFSFWIRLFNNVKAASLEGFNYHNSREQRLQTETGTVAFMKRILIDVKSYPVIITDPESYRMANMIIAEFTLIL